MKLSSAQVKISQIPNVNFEMTSCFLSKFCIPLQFHERKLLCTFLAWAIYTFLKRNPLKWKLLKLSSAQVKIYEITYLNFQTTNVSSQISHRSSVSWMITPLYFFSLNNIYCAQKKPIEVKISETFECSAQNLSNSFCQFWNDESIPLQILYPSSISWNRTPKCFFKLEQYILCSKEAH